MLGEILGGAGVREREETRKQGHTSGSGRASRRERCLQPAVTSLGSVSSRPARGVSALSPELYYDRGNHHEFVSLVKDLARPGEITQSQAFDFEFTHVEKPYESYTGQNVKLR